MKTISTIWVGTEGQPGHGLGDGLARDGHPEPPLFYVERELTKAEKLSLEEGGKDARSLLSGLRRRKRPLSWRAHGDGPQHPDPDPCARAGMHTSGAFRWGWVGVGGGSGAWAGPSDSKLPSCRLPQLPLLRTVCGPGPRGRHPQCPGSHQHRVSKRQEQWPHRPEPASWLCDLGQVHGLSGLSA